MKKTEISEAFAYTLLHKLPEVKRNLSTYEQILKKTLEILKGFTLSN